MQKGSRWLGKRIPLSTLKGWAQGRRQSDATAAAYLSVIERLPKEAQAALESFER